MTGATIECFADFDDIWTKIHTISEGLLQRRPISKIVNIILRLYSTEYSFHENVNFFLQHIAVKNMVKFINKFQGTFSYIPLLQASINHLARQSPFEEAIVISHIMKKIDPELKSLYQSIIGGIIRQWRL
jgi:hypothetical protein